MYNFTIWYLDKNIERRERELQNYLIIIISSSKCKDSDLSLDKSERITKEKKNAFWVSIIFPVRFNE